MLVLFVDDDPEEYELFNEALIKVDPRVDCLYANDGLRALNVLNELFISPDYIFLDINMPIMDGKEFLMRLKKKSTLKDVPVIIYTTTSNEKEKTLFKTLGANHFLVKPTNFLSLVNSVKELIR